MIQAHDTPEKLYLFELSTTSVPIGPNRFMEMVLPCYLIKTTAGRNILIDTGIAPDARSADGPQPRNETSVLQHLAAIELQPSQIDTVICTHFDVDHAGFHNAFPAAEFIVQRAHYDLARSGHPRLALAQPHWDIPSLHYRFVDGDTGLLPGLRLIETSGHITGHQSVLVRLPNSGPILLAIDAVVMQRLFTPDRRAWPTDENEDQLRASTRKLLAIAESERTALVVFGHDGLQWQSLTKSPAFYD
jgi:N-acyl homoserine lactone hydrolase